MIISKDLFIFGEQIFATIIPEGGPTTQQQQEEQTEVIIAKTAPTTTTTTTAVATSTPAKTGNNKIIAEKPAAAENLVEPLKTGTAATTTTTTTTATTINKNKTKLAATTAIKVREQETVAVVVVVAGIGNELQQQQHAVHERDRNSKNNEINLLNKNQKEEAAEEELKQKQEEAAAVQVEEEEEEKYKQNKILKVKQAAAAAVDEAEQLAGATTTTTTTEAAAAEATAEQEPLIRRLTKIKATTTSAASSSLNLLVGEQQQQQQQQVQQQQQQEQHHQQLPQLRDSCLQLKFPSFNKVPHPVPVLVPATTTTTTTTTPATTTTPTAKIKKHFNSADLSRKMRKVMLGNTTSSDHTMVTFPFISEQHRTLQLTFQNINVLHNERQILSDVSGIVSPGEVLAIMGPSGCGKTTLLDCLSGQRRIDGGSIYLNRETLSKKWRRKICYVLQEEIFFTGLTLRETVMYTALLRLPEKMPRVEKMKLVDRILAALELNFCQQTKFGDYLNRGLSGGEKKRANIACELLTNPLLMLLDEPTSGLDSHSAISLMKVLKRYAIQEQKTVVITVHQPSSQMFHMFDKLLLLYGGRTAYFGDVKNIYSYFEDIGVAIKPHYNPADFVLEQIKSYPDIREKLFVAAKESHNNFLNRNCITAHLNHNMPNGNGTTLPVDYTSPTDTVNITSNGSTNTMSTSNIEKTLPHDALITDIMHNYYQDKSNHNHNHIKHEDLVLINNHHNCVDEEAVQQLWCGADSQSNFSSGSSDYHQYETAEDWLDYPTRFHTQFRVLSSRNFKEAKPRMLSKLNWFQTIGLALMAGAIWFQIPRTEEFLHDLQGWMFFSQTYWMLFALFGALNSFPAEREVISKERRSGAYRLSAYYMAKMFGELPLVITLPTVYLMISYPMLGCTSFKLFFLMLVFLLLNTIVAQSVGFFIGACCMDMNMSITLSALYTLATQLFGGYLSSRIPEGLSWIRYTSMIHYAYQNMQILEFREGPAISCGNPSSYEICKNSSASFIPYQEILRAQNSTSPLWLNTLILTIFFLVFRVLGYAVLRYLRCPKT